MNLILLEPHEVDADGHAVLHDGRADHMLRVLRAAIGDDVRVGVIDGAIGVATITAMAPPAVTLNCRFDEPPVAPAVDLLLALPRPKVMKRLWAQLAAIGVGQIILTNAERVERNYFDTHVLAPEGYRPLLIEGLQQARDTRLPRVSIHRQFRKLIEDDLDGLSPLQGTLRLVADPSASSSPIALIQEARPPRALVAIGPEGGWNAFELELLGAHGFTPIGMGPRTLRTDTATVAVLAMVAEAMARATIGP
jgi:16S rRNA (uracil1498-N3)-methyltransferase